MCILYVQVRGLCEGTHFRALGEKRYGTPMILAIPSKE